MATNNNETRDVGCLMVYFTIPGWKKLFKVIDKADLYMPKDPKYGFSTEPHVTITHGFDLETTNQDEVLMDTKNLNAISVSLSTLSFFKGEEYDVVKFDCPNEYLRKANKFFVKKYGVEEEHVPYHPHMTLCYVEKGCGEKYNKMKLKVSQTFSSKQFIYSDDAHKYFLKSY